MYETGPTDGNEPGVIVEAFAEGGKGRHIIVGPQIPEHSSIFGHTNEGHSLHCSDETALAANEGIYGLPKARHHGNARSSRPALLKLPGAVPLDEKDREM